MKKGNKVLETNQSEKISVSVEYLDSTLTQKEIEIEIDFVKAQDADELNSRLGGDMSKLLAAGNEYLKNEAIKEASKTSMPADAIDKKVALGLAAGFRNLPKFARGKDEPRSEQTAKIFKYLAANPVLIAELKEGSAV